VAVKATLEWKGLDELKRYIAQLPEEFVIEAAAVETTMAGQCAAEIRAAYPMHTGTLKSRVGFTLRRDGHRVDATIQSLAPHAWIYEKGTDPRQTKQGWDRGRMPKGNVFYPIVAKHSRRVYTALVAIVARAGFDVSKAA
jgi:hypothetical protein